MSDVKENYEKKGQCEILRARSMHVSPQDLTQPCFPLGSCTVSLDGSRKRETTCGLIQSCCQGPSQFFLASVGGWSCDGVTVSGDLLTRLLEKGKKDSEVKDTFVEMVWK